MLVTSRLRPDTFMEAIMSDTNIYSEVWHPRWYYKMVNKTSGKKYLGQTKQNIQRYLGSGGYWRNHCVKHGGYKRDNIETFWCQWFDNEESAKSFLKTFEDENPKYWLSEEWANKCPENTFNNPNSDGSQTRVLVEQGTHNFIGGDIQGHTSRRRVDTGTHNLLGPAANQKMLENGTHPSFKHKNKVTCYDKNGIFVRVDSHVFWNQTGPVETRDYVHSSSKIGRERKQNGNTSGHL
jgi:hypothetical protein